MVLGVARERVRAAHALKQLPKISQTFRKGKISFSKVRAITRVATPRNENYLLMIAHFGTASHVERLVRNCRSCKRAEALETAKFQQQHQELQWYFDDDGYWVLRGCFCPEQGALIQAALRGNVDTLFALNDKRAIRITPKSSQSCWMGEKMDDHLSVEGLLFRE